MDANLKATLDALCSLFDDELERQQTLLALCVSQGKAAQTHDLEYLEAKNSAIAILLRDAEQAECERTCLVDIVAAAYGLPNDRQRLSAMIAVIPDPWKSRMRDFQICARAVLANIQRTANENARIIRLSMQVIHESLSLVVKCMKPAQAQYDARGAEASRAGNAPSLIDHRG
jgi:hypothetical protein